MRSLILTSYGTSAAVAARQQLYLKLQAASAIESGSMQDAHRGLYHRSQRNEIKAATARNAQLEEARARLPGRRPCYRLIMMLPAVFVVTLVMAVIQILGDSDYSDLLQGNESRPLYDLGHEYLPDLNDENKLIAEIPLFAMLALTFTISWAIEPEDRTRLIRRFALLQSFLYMFRTFSLLGTRLPPSDPKCALRRYEGMSVLTSALRIVFLLDSACTDMIFSGHTAAATSMLSVWFFDNRVHPALKTLGAINLLVCGFSFVASRLHYTVDVIVAFIIAALLACFYASLRQLVKVNYPVTTSFTPVYAKIIHWVEGYDLKNMMTNKIKTKRKHIFDVNTTHES